MKIGILTYANVANFGANLQALSTVSYFRAKGHDAVVLDWSPIDFRSQFQSATDIQAQEHFRFFKDNIPHTPSYSTDSELANAIDENKFDAIVVGSDAVLQHFPFLSRFHFPTSTIYRIDPITSERIFPNAFWGSFANLLERKIPIIGMSGSCQNTNHRNIMPSEKRRMTKAIKQFSFFSVRDTWTQKTIRSITAGEITPPITPDPVFAFNQNYPQSVTKAEITSKFNLPNNYVLVSFKHPQNTTISWVQKLKETFEAKGLACVALPMPNGVRFGHNFDYEIPTPLNPLDWYNLIRFSYAYIGENMHPIIVALHNSVPCFSIDEYGKRIFRRFTLKKTSKIYDILRTFNIEQWRTPVSKVVSPDYIYDKIAHFDKTLCHCNANIKLSHYNEMMNTILNIIENNE